MVTCSLLLHCTLLISFFFFFNDTATTEIYTLSLHDALPICRDAQIGLMGPEASIFVYNGGQKNYAINFIQLTQCDGSFLVARSEEHTSELQSRPHLVCRLLLEKKKKKK